MYDASKGAYASRIKDVYKFLENAGFDVYFRGQHKGDCLAPYCVLVSTGDTKLPNISTVQNTVEILCYVPILISGDIEEFCDSVKETMKGMFPMIVPLHSDIGDYIDDDVKAVMRTIQYKFYKKIER